MWPKKIRGNLTAVKTTAAVLGMVRHLSNPSTVEAEGGESGIGGQPGLYDETLSHPVLATFLGPVTELLTEAM